METGLSFNSLEPLCVKQWSKGLGHHPKSSTSLPDAPQKASPIGEAFYYPKSIVVRFVTLYFDEIIFTSGAFWCILVHSGNDN
jgi:hypothetical protein